MALQRPRFEHARRQTDLARTWPRLTAEHQSQPRNLQSAGSTRTPHSIFALGTRPLGTLGTLSTVGTYFLMIRFSGSHAAYLHRRHRRRCAACLQSCRSHSALKLDLPIAPSGEPRAGDVLKLESLQPIGSFKIRGAWNAVRKLHAGTDADGVWTVSAGNAAQGVALRRARAGVPCSVMVMDTAPQTKLRLDRTPRRHDRHGQLRRVLADRRCARVAAHARTLRPSVRR